MFFEQYLLIDYYYLHDLKYFALNDFNFTFIAVHGFQSKITLTLSREPYRKHVVKISNCMLQSIQNIMYLCQIAEEVLKSAKETLIFK